VSNVAFLIQVLAIAVALVGSVAGVHRDAPSVGLDPDRWSAIVAVVGGIGFVAFLHAVPHVEPWFALLTVGLGPLTYALVRVSEDGDVARDSPDEQAASEEFTLPPGLR